jgi:hypothetical protein
MSKNAKGLVNDYDGNIRTVSREGYEGSLQLIGGFQKSDEGS